MNRFFLLSSIGLSISSAQAQAPAPTIVTSVSQVTDVKLGDPAHDALQRLIERHGLQNLLIGTEFRPTSALSGAELEKMTLGALETLETLRAGSAIPTRLVAPLSTKNCEIKPTNPLSVSGREVADYLKCALGYDNIEKLSPKNTPLTRGEFAIYLESSFQAASMRFHEFYPRPELVQADFLAQTKAKLSAKDSAGALALHTRLEGQRYDYGNARTQTDVASDPAVANEKAAILVQLQRFEEADAVYERTFDLQLEKARAGIVDAAARREKNQPSSAKLALKRAENHLAQAHSTKTSRNSAYLAQDASNKKKAWNSLLDARLDEVQKLLTQAQQ